MNDTNNRSSAIFTPSGCLTGDALSLYVAGSLPDTDVSLVRQHIAECPLCADAADGLKLWLHEQSGAIKPYSDVKAETAGITEKSLTEEKNKDRFPGSDVQKFHTRTEAINERVKQRVNFHKLVETSHRKRRKIKPYAWLAAAATIVLFVGIYFIVQETKISDNLEFATENTMEEIAPPSVEQHKITGSDSGNMQVPVLAMNEAKLTSAKRITNAPKTLAVTVDEEISDDMVMSVTNEAVAARMVEEEKPDTSVPGNDSSPTEVSGIVVTAYKVPMEKKSSGYAVAEAETIQPIGGVKVSKSKNGNHQQEEEDAVFMVVEQMPEFPGGQEKMQDFLAENIKYPTSAAENGIQGTVYVTFIVQKDGRISDAKILRGIGAGCDEEALRVVNKMPRWKPAKQRGKKVNVQFNLPIVFKLD